MLRGILNAASLALLCVALLPCAERRIIRLPGAKPGGNFSAGILVNRTLYISGQGGEDASGRVPVDFESEVKQALENVGRVLTAAGMSPSDVVSVQVYLTDVDTFEIMNTVYTNYFKDPRPARTTVVVSKLVGPGHIEITATAMK